MSATSCKQTRHKGVKMLRRYIRNSLGFREMRLIRWGSEILFTTFLLFPQGKWRSSRGAHKNWEMKKDSSLPIHIDFPGLHTIT